jgi:hypothetical protein
MAIWQTLHARGSVQVGYHAFRRYVTEVLRARPERTRAMPAQDREAARKTAPHPEPTTPPPAAAERRRFEHSPRPRLDEIYGEKK